MNMQSEEYKRYLEILEIGPGASFLEIREAYQHLKSLYSEDSIVTLPIKDEVTEERKGEILREIEEAYQLLAVIYEKENRREGDGESPPSGIGESDLPPLEITDFSGQTLREIRERKGIDLHNIALTTRIQIQHLENIENEDFNALPPETYVRGFVVSYAKTLNLDPGQVAEDYMKKYRKWKYGED
jgi:curved DNA-binding protein CbpA